jgi:hypothetical protein
MSERAPTCAQRIRSELVDREATYADLWRRLDDPDTAADDTDTVYQALEPLGLAVRPVVSVQLSWGGPADWLEIELADDSGHDIRRVTYHFADWFDHAERDVSAREAPALWRAAEHYAEGVRYNLADHLRSTQ